MAWCVLLRPVRLSGVVGQVEYVAGDVLLRGDVGQHPRLLGGRHLQPAHGTMSTLAAPGRGGGGGGGEGGQSPQLEAATTFFVVPSKKKQV